MNRLLLILVSCSTLFANTTFISRIATGGGGGITFVAAAERDFSITQSPVVDYPAGLQSDDIIIVTFISGTHDSSGTPPTGFTKIGADIDGAGVSMSSFWKRSDGTETSETWTTIFAASELGVVVSVAYRGCVNTGNPIEASTPETSASGLLKAVATVSISNDAMVVGIFGFSNGAASAITTLYTSGTEVVGNSTTPDGFIDAGNNQITIGNIINVTPDSQSIDVTLDTAVAACELAIALDPQ